MAAAAQPLTGRSLLGRLALALRSARGGRSRAGTALGAFIADHIATVAALAAADTGLFHIGPAQGWIGLGVALVIAEFKVRG